MLHGHLKLAVKAVNIGFNIHAKALEVHHKNGRPPGHTGLLAGRSCVVAARASAAFYFFRVGICPEQVL